MNIEWVRGRVRYALADTLITKNGQLGNLAGRARIETLRFNRNPPRFLSYANGRMVRVPSSPVKAKQTRAKGKSAILMLECDYSLVPWRRAIGGLDEPLQAWIRYCYGDYRYHAEQLKVVPYMWQKFIEQQPGHISGKVRQRLRGLVLLAVQVVASEISGRQNRYTYAELADMVGISKQNWNKNYKELWEALIWVVKNMDSSAVLAIGRNRIIKRERSELQKFTFSL